MERLKEKLHTLFEITRDILLLYSMLILTVVTFAVTVTNFWLFSPLLLLAVIVVLADRRE